MPGWSTWQASVGRPACAARTTQRYLHHLGTPLRKLKDRRCAMGGRAGARREANAALKYRAEDPGHPRFGAAGRGDGGALPTGIICRAKSADETCDPFGEQARAHAVILPLCELLAVGGGAGAQRLHPLGAMKVRKARRQWSGLLWHRVFPFRHRGYPRRVPTASTLPARCGSAGARRGGFPCGSVRIMQHPQARSRPRRFTDNGRDPFM